MYFNCSGCCAFCSAPCRRTVKTTPEVKPIEPAPTESQKVEVETVEFDVKQKFGQLVARKKK